MKLPSLPEHSSLETRFPSTSTRCWRIEREEILESHTDRTGIDNEPDVSSDFAIQEKQNANPSLKTQYSGGLMLTIIPSSILFRVADLRAAIAELMHALVVPLNILLLS